jgi:hypothetical protein
MEKFVLGKIVSFSRSFQKKQFDETTVQNAIKKDTWYCQWLGTNLMP